MLTKHLEHALSLLIVFLLLIAAASSSGKIFGINYAATNRPKTESHTQRHQLSDEELKELGFNHEKIEPVDDSSWKVLSDKGQQKALIISSHKYGKGITGFAGETPLLIALNEKGAIEKIIPLPNKETPGYFARALTLLKAYYGKTFNQINSIKTDGVTGATYSSKGLIETIQATAKGSSRHTYAHSTSAPAIGWLRTIIVILTLVIGIIITTYHRKNKKIKILLHLLNIIVLGFWCGQYISFTLFHNWFCEGFSLIRVLPAFCIVAAALALPFFRKKNHYCSRICPYGSMQELAYMLPLPKIRIKAKWYKWLRRLRFFIFMCLLFMLWFDLGCSILAYEPFGGFLIGSAPLSVLILSAFFILLGIFIPKPWCSALCPVGSLLNLAEDCGAIKKKTTKSSSL